MPDLDSAQKTIVKMTYILSRKCRESIIQKTRLERLSKSFLTLSWHHCPPY